MPAVPTVTADIASFNAAIDNYVRASKKDAETCLWKQLANWAYKALGILRREPDAKNRLPQFPTGKRGANWPLVSWLAHLQEVHGAARRPLREVSKAEKSARRKSAGFIKALMLGAAKAARRKSTARQGTGIQARVSRGKAVGDRMEASVRSEYRFRRGTTRAFTARDTRGIDRRAEAALEAARPAVVADIEIYLAKKMRENAAKEGMKA